MGYHFFPGALSALLASRIVGARSIYQSTGGPVEILGGGVATESRWLPSIDGPSRHLRPLVSRVCRGFDAIIVRGKRAAGFFRSFADARRIHIIPGSFPPQRFTGDGADRVYDLTFAGRLVPVKQVDDFLRVVACLARVRPQVRAAVVGDGPLMEDCAAWPGHSGFWIGLLSSGMWSALRMCSHKRKHSCSHPEAKGFRSPWQRRWRPAQSPWLLMSVTCLIW